MGVLLPFPTANLQTGDDLRTTRDISIKYACNSVTTLWRHIFEKRLMGNLHFEFFRTVFILSSVWFFNKLLFYVLYRLMIHIRMIMCVSCLCSHKYVHLFDGFISCNNFCI